MAHLCPLCSHASHAAVKYGSRLFGTTSVLTLVLLGCCATAIAHSDAGAEYRQWRERLTAAAKAHDAAEEILCATTIGHRWNWALGTLPSELIEQIVGESELARIGEPRIDLLQMLYDRRWLRSDGGEPSRWWRELSLALVDRNRPEEAISVAAHITGPYELIALQADNRYRQIAKSEFVERDILKAARKDLERRQAAATQQPRALSRIVQVARGFMRLRRFDDVIRLTDSVLLRVDAARPESMPYDDMQRQFAWLLLRRSQALAALGRYDEAVVVLRRACEESKQNPVSLALELARLLAGLNRPQEALAALPALERASLYGIASAGLVRAIAASELNDSAGLDAALHDLRSLAREYPDMLQRALIFASRDDEAATELSARLSDPDLRTDALVELQIYTDDPAPQRIVEWRKRQEAFRRRPDVQRAVQTCGRIRSYPIPEVEY
jgi:tetratricopeptide (TPR) repeat protein